jgi:hypothetical protein
MSEGSNLKQASPRTLRTRVDDDSMMACGGLKMLRSRKLKARELGGKGVK